MYLLLVESHHTLLLYDPHASTLLSTRLLPARGENITNSICLLVRGINGCENGVSHYPVSVSHTTAVRNLT
jgi:hypothetical protein